VTRRAAGSRASRAAPHSPAARDGAPTRDEPCDDGRSPGLEVAERGLSLVARAVEAVAPAPDGGPPLAMRHVHTRLGWLLATGVGLGFGAVVGLLLVLAWQALPGVPMILLGLMAGALVGVALCLVAASQVAALRRRGKLASMLVPVAILVGPVLLVGAAWDALRGRAKKKRHD